MKSWKEFAIEDPELSALGKQMLLQTRAYVGLVFMATIRKDGGPRLHPVSAVLFDDHLYVFISPVSPKCFDLKRDGRYALQPFPPSNNEAGNEFFISGIAKCINDLSHRQVIISETGIDVMEGELLFELILEKAMYTELMDWGTPGEHPRHHIWRA